MMHPTGTTFFARVKPAAMLALLFAVVPALTPLFGQSLADLARQERAKKAQEKKSEKVYTNDDIPSTPSITTSAPAITTSAPAPAPVTDKDKAGEAPKSDGDKTVAAEPGSSPPAETKPPVPGKAEAAGLPDAKKELEKPADAKKEPEKPKDAAADMAKLEKQYRDKFKALRDALAFEQQKLDVMQRELNLMQTQYYSDPNVAMREQTFRGQINQRTQDIEKAKAEVDKAQKAITDLEDELHKNGLPAGWAR